MAGRTPRRNLQHRGHECPPRQFFTFTVPGDPFWDGKRLPAEQVWDNGRKVKPHSDEWPVGTVFRLHEGGVHTTTFVMDAKRGMITEPKDTRAAE